jgi:hypothetical protein
MAGIVSTFIADFSSFNAAVEAAEVTLRKLDTGAAKVGASLSRMTEQLLGQKVVKEATLMAEAIERIGGVSKLTDDELQRMASVAAAAAEKLTLLGKAVPDQIAELAGHAKAATNEFKGMGDILTTLVGGFGAAFITQKVLDFGAAIAHDAVELRNLSLQTGIAVEDLQAFGAVTDDVGISMEQLGNLMAQMARRVAGDDKSAAGALHQFGLTVKELETLSPTELFTRLMEAIDAITDPMEKLQRASDLFGDRAGAAAVKASHNFRQAVEDARKLNTAMSTESVEAAAKATETWDRFWKNFKAGALNATSGWLAASNAVVEAADKGTSKWELLLAFIKDGIAAATGFATGPGANLAGLLAQGAPGKDITLPPTAAGPRGPASDAERMNAILIDQLKTLTPLQDKQLQQLYDVGKLTAENAAVFKVTADQMEAFRQKEDQIIQTQATMAEQLKALTAFELEARTKGNAMLDAQNAKMEKRIELQSNLITKIILENALAGKAIEAREASISGVQNDPMVAAAIRRDERLAEIGRYESAFPGLDTSKSRLQAQFDFDDAMKNLKTVSQGMVEATRPGFNAGQVPFSQLNPAVNITVNGVMDPRSARELADAVGEELMRNSRRQYPSR